MEGWAQAPPLSFRRMAVCLGACISTQARLIALFWAHTLRITGVDKFLVFLIHMDVSLLPRPEPELQRRLTGATVPASPRSRVRSSSAGQAVWWSDRGDVEAMEPQRGVARGPGAPTLRGEEDSLRIVGQAQPGGRLRVGEQLHPLHKLLSPGKPAKVETLRKGAA